MRYCVFLKKLPNTYTTYTEGAILSCYELFWKLMVTSESIVWLLPLGLFLKGERKKF